MKRRLLALPVDARPVVRQQVVDLVACAGWRLEVPAVADLGHLRQPADRDRLVRWLLAREARADGLVLSLDMLLYGGLVPSRFIDDPLPALRPRLALLRELKARRPARPLYAFAATMRISNNDVAEEEKPYWARFGRLIWRWSYHRDRAEQTADSASAREAAAAEAAIPPEVLADYLATRARNFALLREALQLVADGVIDRLALPQDDTASHGLNIAERRALQALAGELGVQDRVHICPGADEVLHTLSAHLIARLTGAPPLRVALAFDDPAHVGDLHALYEDRPLLQSIRDQLAAVGAVAVADPADPGGVATTAAPADLLLAVHTQGTAQGDWAMGRALPERPGIDPAWWPRLHAALDAGLPVALADLAFANGGDPVLLAQPELQVARLFSYAGWNTASNRLGSLLAHAVLARGHWYQPSSRRTLALRLLEDGVYQPVLRAALRGAVGGPDAEARAAPGELERLADALVRPWCNAWAAEHRLGWRVRQVQLPWQRSFEIDLTLEPAP